MERLVTTAQAAEILGLSLQGIHYRIRNNKLKSIKQGGKTYVYISDENDSQITQSTAHQTTQSEPKKTKQDEVLEQKDEQIKLLKKSMKWMRRQHKEEIERLEENQKKLIDVFNSEIKLLQSAFNEMRSIYKPQLENKSSANKNGEVEEITTHKKSQKDKFISLEDFTLYMKKHHKSAEDIKMIIIKALKVRDGRFMYNKKTKKILILNRDFSDLL